MSNYHKAVDLKLGGSVGVRGLESDPHTHIHTEAQLDHVLTDSSLDAHRW